MQLRGALAAGQRLQFGVGQSRLAGALARQPQRQGQAHLGLTAALVAAEALEEQDESIDDLSDCIDGIYDELDDIETAIDDDFDGEMDEDDFIEVVCPHCGETVYFDEDMIDSDDGLICPNCNETIEFEIPGGEEVED